MEESSWPQRWWACWWCYPARWEGDRVSSRIRLCGTASILPGFSAGGVDPCISPADERHSAARCRCPASTTARATVGCQPSLELAEEAAKQNQAADFAEPLLRTGPCTAARCAGGDAVAGDAPQEPRSPVQF